MQKNLGLKLIELDNQTQKTYELNLIEEITNSLTSKDIELIITDNETIKEINLEYRGKNSATDVLSFPLEDMPNSPLGSIIISIDFVSEKATEYKHSENEEFTLLYIHGLLHLLGFDHEDDDGEQRQKELELIQKYNLPNSLIVRNS